MMFRRVRGEGGSSSIQMVVALVVMLVVTVLTVHVLAVLFSEAVITARVDGALARCDWHYVASSDDSTDVEARLKEQILADAFGISPAGLTVRVSDMEVRNETKALDLPEDLESYVRGFGYTGTVRQKWRTVRVVADVSYSIPRISFSRQSGDLVLGTRVEREITMQAEVVVL